MRPEILNKTSADVLALYDKIAAGKVGDVLTYEELSDIVGRSVRSPGSAYGAMRTARRKCLRETGLVWEPLKDHSGLKCLGNDEILKLSARDLKRVQRGARWANKKLGCIDPAQLDDQGRTRLVAARSLLAAIESAAKSSSMKRMELAVNGHTKPLPMGRTLDILKA